MKVISKSRLWPRSNALPASLLLTCTLCIGVGPAAASNVAASNVAASNVAASSAAASSAAGEAKPDELIKSGKGSFVVYCSPCHGTAADGNGQMAVMLKTEPANLTRLRRENGTFPTDWVTKVIYTGGRFLGHGGDMPVWGDAFGGRSKEKIDSIIEYLKTIQTDPGFRPSPK